MATVEERLAKVEKDLEALKSQATVRDSKLGWLGKVQGTFKDDLDFDEIVRLGKEFRDSDRPQD